MRVTRGYKSGNPPHFKAMSRLRETRRSLYGVANANNLIIPFSMRFRRVICDANDSLVNVCFRQEDNFRSYCGVRAGIDANAGQFAG
jgi:hypothetical protein